MNFDHKFKSQYDFSRGWLADVNGFDPDWRTLVGQLYELMQEEGFDANRASTLDDLRKKARDGGGTALGRRKVEVSEGLLRAVNAWSGTTPGGSVGGEAKMRVAALKMLLHTYLLNKSGSRKVWVHSLPDAFLHWSYMHLHAYGTTDQAVRTVLDAQDEHFSSDQKKYLAVATQQALAWSHRAGMVLAQAAEPASGATSKSPSRRDDARALVRRWFADPAVGETELDAYIGVLSRGYKRIIACLNRGQFVLTDWAPLRTASTDEELDYLDSEAFTFRLRAEGMDVVYIEQSFFAGTAGGAVLSGQKNWTRVMLHELAHLVCGAQDIKLGQWRYAWYGIGPHAGFPGAAAVRNADNWAFFGAECAGMLTEGERATALRIV